MMEDCKFNDIRPYRDDEVPAAMQRIAASEFFPLLASYIYPKVDIEQVRDLIRQFQTIRDFQLEVMRCVNEQVIARSITDFSYSGIEYLDPSKRYLFVSNHRDIMLDSCLWQYVLYRNGFETTEITFGSNLMSNPLVIDIGKSNKMFRVERGGNLRDLYTISLHLSEYIRYALTEKQQSVWIAQRNGRTKDGNDATDQGIIKMFAMSKANDKVAALAELNIAPLAISYEWEPCDILKVLELYESKRMKYIKKPGEDLNSILTGIVQPKGKVHIACCPPITADELQAFADCTYNEYCKQVAHLIDQRIYKHYRLTPNNYIAHDIRYGQESYSHFYTPEQKKTFAESISRLQQYDTCDFDTLCDIYLGIYAHAVANHYSPENVI
jgi:1-acyl-sn-glycerol-3-phosphate acyltransferase